METMRSFLGMINYLNRYSALSTHLTAPLSTLTHQATDYKPGKVHYENFNQLATEGNTTSQIWTHYMWQQDHSSKGDET